MRLAILGTAANGLIAMNEMNGEKEARMNGKDRLGQALAILGKTRARESGVKSSGRRTTTKKIRLLQKSPPCGGDGIQTTVLSRLKSRRDSPSPMATGLS